jgi:hypothetical protein
MAAMRRALVLERRFIAIRLPKRRRIVFSQGLA